MSVPNISERGRSTPPSPIRKLASYADAAKAQAIRVYHLNIGQPDIPTPPEFFRAVRGFDEKVLAYCPSQGIPELRKKLLSYYHGCGFRDVAPEDLMVTTGGSEAILFSMMAVASPGEEIITFEPFYPNYNGFAAMAGIRLVPVGTDPNTGYHLPSRASIEARITSKTRALMVCSPNNPTGAIYDRNEMEMLRDLVMERNLFLISDEAYREFIFEGEQTGILSFPELAGHAILVDSCSKRYMACGARIGSVVSKNTSVMETLLKFAQARL
jgi:aspartate aminotransferase